MFLEKAFERFGRIDTRTLLKRTPLHFACKANNAAAVSFLLDKGANPEAKDVFGDTPKDLATDEAVIRLLDEHEDQRFVRDRQAKRIDLEQDEKDAVSPRLTTEEFIHACRRYLLRFLLITCATGAFGLLYYGNMLVDSNYLIQEYGEIIEVLIPLSGIVVMFLGWWWVDRGAKKTGEVFCTHCKKSLIQFRHGVIATKKCPYCGHRHLNGQNQ